MAIEGAAGEAATTSTEAQLAEGVTNALASEAQVAAAPESQVTVADSITTPENLQTTPAWYEQLGLQGVDEAKALEQARQNFQLASAAPQYYQQAQHYARQAQELQSRLNAFEAAKQVATQQAPAPKPEQPKLPWEAVEYDPDWQTWIDPETRNWKPTTPVSVIEGYTKYEKNRRQVLNTLMTKPQEVFQPFIESHAKQLVTPLQEKLEALESRLAQQAQQQELQGFIAPYLPQLYAWDQATNQVKRDQFGNPIETPMGQSFNHFASILQQNGYTDPKQITLAALQAARIQELQSQLAQQSQPAAPQQPTREQHEQAIYKKPANGVAHKPNRGNTVNASQGAAAPPQNQRFSPEDLLMSSLRDVFPNGMPVN